MLKALFLFHLQEHDLDEERSQVYLFTFSYVMHYLSFLDTDAAISDITTTANYWPDKPICLPNASLANFSTCWILWSGRGEIYLSFINTILAKELRELSESRRIDIYANGLATEQAVGCFASYVSNQSEKMSLTKGLSWS